jgi:hypothetical protein
MSRATELTADLLLHIKSLLETAKPNDLTADALAVMLINQQNMELTITEYDKALTNATENLVELTRKYTELTETCVALSNECQQLRISKHNIELELSEQKQSKIAKYWYDGEPDNEAAEPVYKKHRYNLRSRAL